MDEFTKSINIFVNSGDEGSSDKEAEKKEKKEEQKKDTFRKRMGEVFAEQMKEIGKKMVDTFKNAMTEIEEFFKQSVKDAWSELKTMASYNLGNSLFQTSTQRENALKYGLNNAQNYAMDKSMSILGLQNEDDLVMMNERQRNVFFKQMDKWTKFYEDAEQSGLFENIEDLQLEFQEFKDEIMMDIAKWIMENKDDIKAGIKAIISALKVIAKVVGAIANFLSIDTGPMDDAERAAKTSDIISNYSSSNSKSVNVKVDNTFNGIDTKNQASLLNAGELTYKQIIESLK